MALDFDIGRSYVYEKEKHIRLFLFNLLSKNYDMLSTIKNKKLRKKK